MKWLWSLGALFFFLFGAHLSSGHVSPRIVRKCINSTEIEVTELALFYATDFQMISTRVKCYVSCLFEKAGLVENGVLTEDAIYLVKNEDLEKMKALVKTCDRSQAEGTCEPNFQAFQCWIINKAIIEGENKLK